MGTVSSPRIVTPARGAGSFLSSQMAKSDHIKSSPYVNKFVSRNTKAEHTKIREKSTGLFRQTWKKENYLSPRH